MKRHSAINTDISSAFGTLLLTALLVFSAVHASAANWPSWRGSADGSGVTSELGLPTQWSATQNVRWHVPLPDAGNATPIIWGDRIFLAQTVDAEKRRTLMCLDRNTGKILWQQGVVWDKEEETHETNPYCSSTPVTDGQRVIVWFGSAGVFCFDFEGKQLWKRDLGRQEHIWGYGSSPVLHEDLCILYHGPATPGALVALDKNTGEVRWKTEEPAIQKRPRTDGFRGRDGSGVTGTFSSPIIIRAGGREELVMSFPQRVVAYDPKTGKELWRCDGLNELIYGSPIVGEGLVVAMGGFFGSAIAVKPGGHGDVTDTARVWREERAKKNRCGSGIIVHGRLYLANMEGFVECLDVKTGQQLWEERLPAKGAKSESWSCLTRSGDLLYAINKSGDCVVFKATAEFQVLSVNPLDGAMTNASLAVSDGELFIRTHTHLWCIKSQGLATAQAR